MHHTREPQKKTLKIVLSILIPVLLLGAVGVYFCTSNNIMTLSQFKNRNHALHNISAQPTKPQSTPMGTKIKQTWSLTLVNNSHFMAKGYKPALKKVGNGYSFDARAAQSLVDMLSAAKAQGLHPLICSGYRNQKKQTQLFHQQVSIYERLGYSYSSSFAKALMSVAYPGTSEHQLGLAADIVSRSYRRLDNKQAETPEAKWLMANCYHYGFILRYPPDKADITGVKFEPWHYRYVGVEAATVIMQKKICLEEYLGEVN